MRRQPGLAVAVIASHPSIPVVGGQTGASSMCLLNTRLGIQDVISVRRRSRRRLESKHLVCLPTRPVILGGGNAMVTKRAIVCSPDVQVNTTLESRKHVRRCAISVYMHMQHWVTGHLPLPTKCPRKDMGA